MMELVDPDEVLKVVRMYGPVVPIDIRKILKKGDSITIGAALSQLVHGKQVLVTNVKQGGSPFYYAPGTESKLDKISGYLNAKDKQTYEILKREKVLRDSAQDPLTRVSLRQIKDFSRTFTVNINGEKELFWRYFLVEEPEAIQILRNIYAPSKKTEEKNIKHTQSKAPETQIKQSATQKSGQTQQKPKPIQKAQVQQTHEKQTALTEKYEKEDILKTVNDEFLNKIKGFFNSHEITIKDAELVRKGSEYNFIIEMKTPMGNAEYFCKAKSKKKSTDGDLSQAYLQGQTRRIPTVYLTTGEVAKKAKQKTNSDYKGMLIKEI